MSETNGEQVPGNRISLELAAAAADFKILSEIVNVESLPVRLREGFADRPWPTHRLDERLVDRAYIPIVPVDHSVDPWVLEIAEDNRLGIDHVRRKISGERLRLLNIMLLTRDWALRSDEWKALGFASHVRESLYKHRLLSVVFSRLVQAVAPHPLLEGSGNRDEGYAHRLHPAMRVVDKREWHK